MKIYFLFFFLAINWSIKAQNIDFSDPLFKAKLLVSSTENSIAKNLNDEYFAIDANNNGEIDQIEANQVSYLDVESSDLKLVSGIEKFNNLSYFNCSNNNISNLNTVGLLKLSCLNCSNNSISTLTLGNLPVLENLNCNSNLLTNISILSFNNLETFDCSNNKITSLEFSAVPNLKFLDCNNNLLTQLSLNELIALEQFNCSRNKIESLDLKNTINLISLNCSYNLLTQLDASSSIELETLECNNNSLASLLLNDLYRLSSLNCSFNQIKVLEVSHLYSMVFFNCSNNQIQNLTLTGMPNLKVVNCSFNLINELNTFGINNLQFIYAQNNKLRAVDFSNQFNLQIALLSNNQLQSLNLKNGTDESIVFVNNPNLVYICADESQISSIKNDLLFNGITNCELNSYCTFVPGGNYYTLNGNLKFDFNNNGCDPLDINYKVLKLNLSDGESVITIFPDTSGNFSYLFKEGEYSIEPVFEKNSSFTVTPSNYTFSLSNETPIFTAPFCVKSIVNKNDLEVILVPLNQVKQNTTSKYKIILKNNGTTTQNGILNFTYNSTALRIETQNPSSTTQNASSLNWNFSNLQPQERKEYLVDFDLNNSIIDNYELEFKAEIDATNDETPLDNLKILKQIVGFNSSIQEKIALDGATISSSKIGDYLYYLIRFENTTGALVQNIVIKDLVDTSKLDISSLKTIDASHSYSTKITNGESLEFFFENCNLPYNNPSNVGFVIFKIKSKTGLMLHDEIKNSASIYFEPNTPTQSTTAITKIQSLSIQNQYFNDNFNLYPNPAHDFLTIINKQNQKINSIYIYNSLGQQVLIVNKLENENNTVNVSNLTNGLYFVKIGQENQTIILKMIKN